MNASRSREYDSEKATIRNNSAGDEYRANTRQASRARFSPFVRSLCYPVKVHLREQHHGYEKYHSPNDLLLSVSLLELSEQIYIFIAFMIHLWLFC